MWMICAHEAQSLELFFQTNFAGAIMIRHRGSEESADAVRRQFTKWVADMYGLPLLEDSADIHAAPMKEELKIRTHYESLDIAQSKKVHYLCFTLPEGILPDRDAELLERIKNEEPVPPERPVRPPRMIAASGKISRHTDKIQIKDTDERAD